MTFRSRALGIASLLLVSLLGTRPLVAQAKPRPAGFRLFARVNQWMQVNRVSCGINGYGELCVDAGPYDGLGGGFWPKGSPQMYMFNSGVQVAGVIEDAGGWAWAGDTTGAFFFDPNGTKQHGQAVEGIWNYADAADRAHWPEMARVPIGDPSASIYGTGLQGKASASEGDLWMLGWEGNPGLNAGRPHPLGIALETRVLGWNAPAWNRDIIYFVFTLYNVSSSCPADYAAIRPGLREELVALGARFQSLNETAFQVDLPACGYTIHDLYIGQIADADVSSNGGNNYTSVNLPAGLGYTYNDVFPPADLGYQLTGGIGAAPFINGYGFVGMQFLKTPQVGGPEGGIRLYTGMFGGGLSPNAANTAQLFRLISGTLNPALGDAPCNYSQSVDRVCFVKSDGHADVRSMQSAGPTTLTPGGSVSIVMAYLFASAVASPGCPVARCTGGVPSVLPGDARRLTNVAQLAVGAELVDSLTGFRGYVDDNADNIVQLREFRVVRGSLLAKAQLARIIFDNGFLVPAAPDAPDFFLVPGDDQVTVLWRPSATETTGDPFFNAPNGPADPASPAYDPNYRQFDTEGYRIYRGRTDDPSSLALIAEFGYFDVDSKGHPRVMRDYLGAIDPSPTCAPELGRNTVAEGCPVDFDDPPAPGGAYTVYTEHPSSYQVIQVRLGDRHLVSATGLAYLESADTVTLNGGSGVPFTYVDAAVRSNLRYFYAVTAFDLNSIQSGPSTMESPRMVKAVVPSNATPNHEIASSMTRGVRGRGVLRDPSAPVPTLDPATGRFSGPMPAADGAELGLAGEFVAQVVSGTVGFSAKLDSIALGKGNFNLCCVGTGPAVAAHYYFTVSNGTTSTQLDVPLTQQLDIPASAGRIFDGVFVDPTSAGRYGGSDDLALQATLTPTLPTVGHMGGAGVAAALIQPGFTSVDFSIAGTTGMRYDGARWYSGANETMTDPTSPGSCGIGIAACILTDLPNFNNAGSVTGAGLVYMPRAYTNINREWRNLEMILAGARRAADVRVYWGAGGVVDSVIDLTHNVPLSWDSTRLGGGWAILNTAGQTAAGSRDARTNTLTFMDWACVEPLRTMHHADSSGATGPFFDCTSAAPFPLSKTATLGAVAVGVGDNQNTSNPGSVRNTANNNGGNGFSMYLAGYITFFGNMAALPTAGTTWTLRSYAGVIFGGQGGAPGSLGPYKFISRPRPFTAVGAELVVNYTVTQNVRGATAADLRRVHTVPDPYYLFNDFESSTSEKVIKFVNLPDKAIVRIYSLSGVLVRVLEHHSTELGSTLDWDVRNRGGNVVASGVYFYHIEAPSGERRVGRMTLVTFGR